MTALARLRHALAARRARRLAAERARILRAAAAARGWTSAAEVAARAGRSPTAVHRALAELEREGLLESRRESARIITGRPPHRLWWATPRARKMLT